MDFEFNIPLLGNYINELRVKRNLTLRDVSEKSGISPSQLSKIERNEAVPKIATLDQIASALEVNPDDLYYRAGIIPSSDPLNKRVITGMVNGEIPYERGIAMTRLYTALRNDLEALMSESSFKRCKETTTFARDYNNFITDEEFWLVTRVRNSIEQLEKDFAELDNMRK
ncbi:helix-turn-helix transcriptional regulator [Paenibacillus sp. FSL R5-0636]|uniref:helix-turn-helix domain-containing protein n=1 Tax=Paenibacillus TaxID=44249 RepID=UPI00096F29D1|nr:helix-turn-helix transcriptional regulator [Paenibacillus odorifer]OMC96248.1 hypothetical protein BJP49_11140 [Paenibacillus odorifer]